MTHDEKLAVIAGNLRDAVSLSERADAFATGSLFELAAIALEKGSAEDALSLARLLIPADDRIMLAEFCRSYYKYKNGRHDPFPQPESAELPNTVMIPEIARLDEAVSVLQKSGMSLERLYGDSFSACAEDVEYGHSRYVLMPMSDPSDGRLRSFDRLRDKYGLKIHAAVNMTDDEGGIYSYQLCALGLPDISDTVAERLSFTAYTKTDVLSYLNGVKRFGANVISAEIIESRVRAVLDTASLDNRRFAGLMMYLGEGADAAVDGYYNEI